MAKNFHEEVVFVGYDAKLICDSTAAAVLPQIKM
jgi:hypothetical protein